MRLKDVDKDTLHRIEKFVQEKKNVIPVKSDGGEDLVKAVKREFGIMLSPSQIYKLQRGIKTYRVNLPSHLAEDLRIRYGSVGNAIKKLAPLLEKPKELHGDLERMWRILLEKGKVTDSEFSEIFKDWNDKYHLLGQLFKIGFAYREGKYIVATTIKYDPILYYMLGF